MLMLDSIAICRSDNTAQSFSPADSGWNGLCDDCAVIQQDHFSGQHTDPDSACADCF